MSKKTTLNEISELITKGTTPTSIGGEFTDSGIYFVKSESICDSKFLNRDVFGYIDEETDRKLKRSRLAKDDLLFSIAGAYLGKIGIVRNEDLPSNTNQAVGIVRLKKNIVDVNYVFYYFSQNHINKYINKLSSQSSQPNLNLDLLGKLEIELKDINTQQKIAAVLSSLDSKIELNNKINAELEAMAKTLYDYWFVQFDFPDSDGKPYKTSGGKMVWNDELKREIPDGWEVGTLSDIENNIVTGKTPLTANDEFYNGDVPFITIGDIRGNMHIVDTQLKLSQKGADSQKNKWIPKGTLCVSCIASIGLIGFTTQDSQTNQQINSIVFSNEENKPYLYFSLNDYFMFSKGAKTGNTFLNMNKGDFEGIRLIKPDKNFLLIFSEFTKPIVKQIFNLSKENQTLSELRDWLLPMLMNGQVRVG
jgi:type I restriction enzyme S subunit